jgi:SAM-dependent methyltransferase
MPLLGRIAGRALDLAGRLVNRHVIILPRDARDDRDLLSLTASYRVDRPCVSTALRDVLSGRLDCTLLGYRGHFPTERLWHGTVDPYDGPAELVLDLVSGDVSLNGRRIGQTSPAAVPRRFCWWFELRSPDRVRHRTTSFYRVPDKTVADERYYTGDHYVDYEAEAEGQSALVGDMLDGAGACSPVLEIGCATGVLTADLIARGYDAYGLEPSDWALARARERVGAQRVVHGSLTAEGVPPELAARGPFGAIVMWSVLEHCAEPLEALAAVTRLAANDARLIIHTSNSDSLTHRLFGASWEGFVDWTHAGVSQVSLTSLTRGLSALGWDVLSCHTDGVWARDADPTAATVRDWWSRDARFRRLIRERDAGDFITCVARRTPS